MVSIPVNSSNNILQPGDEIYIKAKVVDGRPTSEYGYVRVEVGRGISKVNFAVLENDVVNRVPAPKEIEEGDNAYWNHAKVKVICIDGESAWVKLYQPSDMRGKPSGSYSSCHKYKDVLKPINLW